MLKICGTAVMKIASHQMKSFVVTMLLIAFNKKNKPNLTFEERKLMHTYTYFKEPVKEWHQVNDYEAIQECNRVKWREISKLIGDCHGFENSLSLYRSKKAKIVNVIERIICKNGCYYFPEKCFMAHGYDLKTC